MNASMQPPADTITPICLFESSSDNQPKRHDPAWVDLVTLLTDHDERADKDGPLWSPTIYREGAFRGNEGVVAITAAVGDFDDGISLEEVKDRLQEYEYVVHSTFNSAPDKVKFRVVIPFTRPVPVEEWPKVKTQIDIHVFRRANDQAAKDACRMYYLSARLPGAVRFAEHHPGEILDPDALPPLPQETGHEKAADPISERIPQGERNSTLASIAGTMRRRGMSYSEILAALKVVNAERCEPPLAEKEVETIALSVSRYEPAAHPTGHTKPRWPEPMGDAAFYGLAGEVVGMIEPHTEACKEALLANFLIAVGNAIGPGPHAVAEGDTHSFNFFGVLVGESSKGRKGSSWGQIERLLREVSPDWAPGRIASGLSSGEGLIWAVRDPNSEDSGVTDKRLLVIDYEFASTLKVMSRQGNTLSPVIRLAWDNRPLQILTKNTPAMATGAHISLIGHITGSELRRYLSETEAGNGFANRFLWFCTQRARCLPEGGGTPNFGDLPDRLRRAIEVARTLGVLRRDDAAKRLWRDEYPELSEGKPGLFGAVTARSEAQVLRLSALYAAIDGSHLIKVPHLEAALAVWQYAEDSARYIFGNAIGDREADRILRALRQNKQGLTRTEINYLFTGNVPAARINQALLFLSESQAAFCEKRETGGRPEEVWFATE